ncbi:MAG: acyl-ACP--UDP-N-acetylglucosamine O-acyltransferase [Chitinophagales bacterium]|nr:acyl-ACP--UDP-N-acetylglucosamine O-acyltransferase [Chitinophagales bacterium]
MVLTNFIHQNAKIGNQTTIGYFSFIDDDVIIGDNCTIANNVTIYAGTRIGNNCTIFPNAVIGAVPQDLKFNGEYSTVEIHDHVTIRECATINRGTSASGKTVVGSHSLIMAYVHIAHDCMIGKHCILANSTNLAGHVTIDDYAYFGGMSGAHQFTHIGKHAFISGGSMIGKDVPPYITVMRNPAQYAGINVVGLKRQQFDVNSIHQIQDIYRLLFGSGLNTSQALEKIEQDIPSSIYKTEIVQFVNEASRGIIKGII